MTYEDSNNPPPQTHVWGEEGHAKDCEQRYHSCTCGYEAHLEAAKTSILLSRSWAMPCPCTTFEQDEDCPVGYPSLLCSACDGKGIAPVDKVVALAAEMMKVAEQVDELEDPFAAWETIDLIKSQHGQLRKVVEELKFALFASDMTIKDRADQAARLVLAATSASEVSDNA